MLWLLSLTNLTYEGYTMTKPITHNDFTNAINLIKRVNKNFIKTNNIQISKDIKPFKSYNDLITRYDGIMPYDTDNATNTIYSSKHNNASYSSKHSNALFRVVHDYLHLTYKLKFTLADETVVSSLHQDMIVNYGIDRGFDTDIITLACRIMYIDIVKQAEYYWTNRTYVKNQLKFCLDHLA